MNPDDRLQRDLDQLRATTTFPPTPDFAGRIVDVLPSRFDQRSSRRWSPAGRMHRPLAVFAVVALLLILALMATLAIPAARDSVARWLHIDLPGIRIERIHDDADRPRVPPSSLGGALLLGTPVSLDQANDLLTSPMLAPATALVGDPSEIWQRNGGETISLLYPPSEALPEIGETGVGMLLTRMQPRGSDGMSYIKKSFGARPVESVSIGGREGWWIVDGQLTVLADNPAATTTRASGHVLIWWDGDDVVWRLESALAKDDAIRIASSLAPVREATGNRPTRRAVWVDDGVASHAFVSANTPLVRVRKEVSHASSHRWTACRRPRPLQRRPGGRGRIRSGRTCRAAW